MCEVDQATGSLEKSYIHADGQILSQVRHGAQSTDVYYYVHDRLGSVRMVVGYDGQTVSVANGYAYRPFGAFYEGECVETVDSPFCFAGQWRDAEIDQYDLRARQYDPAMMRFMTRDPVRGKMREPLTLHRYLYCVNDPLNRTDPSGRFGYIIGIGAGMSIDADLRAANASIACGVRTAIASIGHAISAMNAWTSAMMSVAAEKSIWAAAQVYSAGSHMLGTVAATGWKGLAAFGSTMKAVAGPVATSIGTYYLTHPQDLVESVAVLGGDPHLPTTPGGWATYGLIEAYEITTGNEFDDVREGLRSLFE